MFSIQNFFDETFGFAVRGTIINGVPYVSGFDVAKSLGYVNPDKAIRQHVFDEYKMTRPNWTGQTGQRGGAQYMVFISEPGIYQLIFSSKMPKAQDFQRWVFEEVLPKLRQAEIDELKEENAKLKALVNQNSPRVGFYNNTIHSNTFNIVSAIAQDYGLKAYELNKLLADLDIQYKGPDRWHINSKYADRNYTVVRTRFDEFGNEYEYMAWTNEGLKFIEDVLRDYYGMLPKRLPPWDFVIPEEYEEDGIGNS